MLDEPWSFKDWLESIPQKSAYVQRQALLHLMFPNDFEAIVSRDHKQLLIAAFRQEIPEPLPEDPDRALAVIREHLLPVYGDQFSFYDPGLRERWRPEPSPVENVEGSVRGLLEAILLNLQGSRSPDGQPIPEQTSARRELVQTRLPSELRKWVAPPRVVKGSNGQGNAAAVPWVLVSDTSGNDSAQIGFYLVYLFAADGSRVCLSLNQGTTGASPGLISTRTLQLRRIVGPQSELFTVIELASEAGTPAKYERGNAFAAVYEADEIPDDARLRGDLERMIDLLSMVEDSELAFETDPIVHVLLRCRPSSDTDIIREHQQIAERSGSVWWGRVGSQSLPDDRLEVLRTQMATFPGLTKVFLVSGPQVWRTKLLSIASDAAEVDHGRRPGYYKADECGDFFELRDFTEITAEELDAEYVLVSDGTEGSVGRGLRGRSTHMYLYEVLADSSAPIADVFRKRPTSELADEIGWSTDRVEWLLDSLQDDSPQVILSGPPGTGKTYVAEAVARYLLKGDEARMLTVQFHPSYGYEEFVQGLRPEPSASGSITFNPVDGPLLRLARATAKDGQLRVLIVDEMNRANLPRVFGELLFMLEYRGQSIDLAYEQGFSLPKDLLIIGTMNTADRSIRSIDIALRRRFDIYHCQPDPQVLRRHYSTRPNENQVSSLYDGFDQLNNWLSDQLDEGFLIGHSFFMVEQMTPDRLSRIWELQVGPILSEYFYDRPDIVPEDLFVERFF